MINAFTILWFFRMSPVKTTFNYRWSIVYCLTLLIFSCSGRTEKNMTASEPLIFPASVTDSVIENIIRVEIEKELLYDKYTLSDSYPYRQMSRGFQWDKIQESLITLETLQSKPVRWGFLQNRRNKNGLAPIVKNHHIDEYHLIADTFGVERDQSVPLYLSTDLSGAERYGRDGALVRFIKDSMDFVKVAVVDFEKEWFVPDTFVRFIDDSIRFRTAIFIDRINQNITLLEKPNAKWLVRSMNPATTGLYRPPYERATPTGTFVLQEKKPKMYYYKDGTTEQGGFAPYANRFCSGGYIHGVPVNAPGTELIEFSPTLGTTPRSHMCVRNATSHAKYIYDNLPVEKTLVFIFD